MASSQDAVGGVADPESMAEPEQPPSAPPKRRKHRAGRNRKKSKRDNYNPPAERAAVEALDVEERPSMGQPAPFYRLQSGSHSNSSLESEALLDHREHGLVRPRRTSLQQTGFTRPSLPLARHRSTVSGTPSGPQRSKLAHASGAVISEDEDEDNATDRTPLLSRSRNHSRPELSRANSGHQSGRYGSSHQGRRSSVHSHTSSRKRIAATTHLQPTVEDEDYDVNNPPSVPASPKLGSLDDLMINVNDLPSSTSECGRDAVIDIDEDGRRISDSPSEGLRRRTTVADLAARDVCFPGDASLSEIAEEDRHSTTESTQLDRRRTRTRQWPDLEVLEEWSREEKEERTQQEHVRAKKINEPVMVGGRLRPGKTVWHREDDEPFRFTYFNEMFDGTIHARTISDLLQEGATFKDLFLPDPIELQEESEEEDEDDQALARPAMHPQPSVHTINGRPLGDQRSRQPSMLSDVGDKRSPAGSKPPTRPSTPSGQNSHTPTPRPCQKSKRYGPRPTFWLDVLQPTDMEMKALSKAFGIHQLTTEDILMQEQREKVELFASYYFLNYRSFEQDKESEDYMDPVNFYAVVFRDGIITFHHSQTPHPANVRRRIRQLNDYMSPTADWISYALIDDITDVYAPRVSQIEEEVDEIDEEILYLHVTSADDAEGLVQKGKSIQKQANSDKSMWNRWPFKANNQGDMGAQKAEGDRTAGMVGGDMLRRVGECRKKVMGLYRLLGNKADVIKGFAKRCNENWEVAPRSEIGLYLGDIQDHIVTMNNNLSHYEK